jgi:hypothetical protein
MIRNRHFIADVPAFKRLPDETEQPEYLRWCHAHLFCVITMERAFDAHHSRRDEFGPIGTSNHDDRRIIPIVARLHRPGYPNSLHTLGERPFFDRHGIAYHSLSAMIWVSYDMGRDVEQAQAAIIGAMPR